MISRSLFWWLNPLLLEGFGKVLSANDLFPISEKLSSAKVSKAVQSKWNSSNQNRKHALVQVVVLSYWWPSVSTIVPRLCTVGLKLAQPFLIEEAIAYVDAPVGTLSEDIGYGLIAAFGLVYVGIAIFTG